MVIQIWLLASFDKMNTWLSKSPPKLQAPAGVPEVRADRGYVLWRQTDPKGNPEDAGHACSIPSLQVSTEPSHSSFMRGLGFYCSTVRHGTASSHPRVILPPWEYVEKFSVVKIGGCYWHLVGKSQGCCSSSYKPHPPTTNSVQAQNVSGAEEDGSIQKYKSREMIFLSNSKFAISPTLHTGESDVTLHRQPCWEEGERH